MVATAVVRHPRFAAVDMGVLPSAVDGDEKLIVAACVVAVVAAECVAVVVAVAVAAPTGLQQLLLFNCAAVVVAAVVAVYVPSAPALRHSPIPICLVGAVLLCRCPCC